MIAAIRPHALPLATTHVSGFRLTDHVLPDEVVLGQRFDRGLAQWGGATRLAAIYQVGEANVVGLLNIDADGFAKLTIALRSSDSASTTCEESLVSDAMRAEVILYKGARPEGSNAALVPTHRRPRLWGLLRDRSVFSDVEAVERAAESGDPVVGTEIARQLRMDLIALWQRGPRVSKLH